MYYMYYVIFTHEWQQSISRRARHLNRVATNSQRREVLVARKRSAVCLCRRPGSCALHDLECQTALARRHTSMRPSTQ